MHRRRLCASVCQSICAHVGENQSLLHYTTPPVSSSPSVVCRGYYTTRNVVFFRSAPFRRRRVRTGGADPAASRSGAPFPASAHPTRHSSTIVDGGDRRPPPVWRSPFTLTAVFRASTKRPTDSSFRQANRSPDALPQTAAVVRKQTPYHKTCQSNVVSIRVG